MADIFISYAREDRVAAKRLAKALENQDWSVWWDPQIEPGQDFDEAIKDELKAARCVVVLWSDRSSKSRYVKGEARFAMAQDKLVPAFIEKEVEPPFDFHSIQAVDLFDWDGNTGYAEYQKLVRQLAQRIEEVRPRGDVSPETPPAEMIEPEPKPDVGPKPEPPLRSETKTAAKNPPSFLKRRGIFVGVVSLAVAALAGGALYYGIPQKTGVDSKPISSTASQEADKTEPSFGMKEIIILDEPKVEPVEADKTPPVPQKSESQSARPAPSVFREPDMVVIPAGQFEMGCVSGKECMEDELPVRTVIFDKPFGMGKYEVTFEEYEKFARAIGQKLPDDKGWGRGDRPVIYVSWKDAVAYAEWLSEQSGKRYRLPSEAEWEYAARAGTETAYWWGNDIGGNRANCDGCGSEWDNKKTAPIALFEPNPWGLYDTAGNVWEWVHDCWNNSYEGAPSDGSAWESGDCIRRVIRGGSWYDGPRYVRSAYRWFNNVGRYNFIGFRLAQDLHQLPSRPGLASASVSPRTCNPFR